MTGAKFQSKLRECEIEREQDNSSTNCDSVRSSIDDEWLLKGDCLHLTDTVSSDRLTRGGLWAVTQSLACKEDKEGRRDNVTLNYVE